MSAGNVVIKLATKGRPGSVVIDGMDLANYVTALNLDRTEDGQVRLVLSLVAGTLTADVGGAQVSVDSKSREALLALGWTPPAGDA